MNKDKIYSVFVGGTEVNDFLLNRDQAEIIAQEYIKDGYIDVSIVDTHSED